MTGIRVSDRALVRFLERAGGYDVEGLRAGLERSLERAHSAAASIGVRDHLILADGLAYVVRNGTVSTVLPQGSRGFQAGALSGRGEPGAR